MEQLVATVNEAASMLKVSRATLYKMAAANHVKFVKFGAMTRVDIASVKAYSDAAPAAKLKLPKAKPTATAK